MDVVYVVEAVEAGENTAEAFRQIAVATKGNIGDMTEGQMKLHFPGRRREDVEADLGNALQQATGAYRIYPQGN